MTLLCASRAVRVRVTGLAPSAVADAGLAVKVDVAALGAPAMNETLVAAVALPMVAVIVLLSARVDARVVAKTPFASVGPLAAANVLFVPLLANDTDCAATGLP